MLRNELGYLTIVDPERLNIIKTRATQWRVYVPKGAHYTLRAVGKQIPAKGHPYADDDMISVDLPEGEFTLTARMERLKDESKFTVQARRVGGQIGWREDNSRWFGSGSGGSQWGAVVGEKGVETFGRNESFDLFRQHEWRIKGQGFTPPGPMPSDGMLIWIEAQ